MTLLPSHFPITSAACRPTLYSAVEIWVRKCIVKPSNVNEIWQQRFRQKRCPLPFLRDCTQIARRKTVIWLILSRGYFVHFFLPFCFLNFSIFAFFSTNCVWIMKSWHVRWFQCSQYAEDHRIHEEYCEDVVIPVLFMNPCGEWR